jgi:hypothetical protein
MMIPGGVLILLKRTSVFQGSEPTILVTLIKVGASTHIEPVADGSL